MAISSTFSKLHTHRLFPNPNTLSSFLSLSHPLTSPSLQLSPSLSVPIYYLSICLSAYLSTYLFPSPLDSDSSPSLLVLTDEKQLWRVYQPKWKRRQATRKSTKELRKEISLRLVIVGTNNFLQTSESWDLGCVRTRVIIGVHDHQVHLTSKTFYLRKYW